MKTITVRLNELDEANMEFIRKHLNQTLYFRLKPITNTEIIRRALDALWSKCAEEEQQKNR